MAMTAGVSVLVLVVPLLVVVMTSRGTVRAGTCQTRGGSATHTRRNAVTSVRAVSALVTQIIVVVSTVISSIRLLHRRMRVRVVVLLLLLRRAVREWVDMVVRGGTSSGTCADTPDIWDGRREQVERVGDGVPVSGVKLR